MNTSPTIPGPEEQGPYRLVWLTQKFRWNISHLYKQLEAGMTPSAAFLIASEEITRHYREACALDGLPCVNTMLDPTAVDLQARFALDAALAAKDAGAPDGEVRKQFWAIFRKETTPSLTP